MSSIDLTQEFSVEYPVNFRSGGDTTKDAFWKHIQEIQRIYDIMNAINAASASSDSISGAISGELQRHEINPNTHQNIKLKFTNLTDKINAVTQIADNSIPTGKINGLSALISNIVDIPTINYSNAFPSSKIQENGYVKLANSLVIQWGNMTLSKPLQEKAYKVTFSQAFEEKCLNISLTLQSTEGSNALSITPQTIKEKITKTDFEFFLQYFWNSVDEVGSYQGNVSISYIAIGY